jgi:hypothetical protein
VGCEEARRWLADRLGNRGNPNEPIEQPDGEAEETGAKLHRHNEETEEPPTRCPEQIEQPGSVSEQRELIEEALFELSEETEEPARANRGIRGASGSVPQAVHLAALTLVGKTLDRHRELEVALNQERARCDEVIREGQRAERRAYQLAVELQSYQRALGEQAESLAEERSRRLALELEKAAINVDQVEKPSAPQENIPTMSPSTSATMERLPAPATTMGKRWGRRLRRWFLGEKAV